MARAVRTVLVLVLAACGSSIAAAAPNDGQSVPALDRPSPVATTEAPVAFWDEGVPLMSEYAPPTTTEAPSPVQAALSEPEPEPSTTLPRKPRPTTTTEAEPVASIEVEKPEPADGESLRDMVERMTTERFGSGGSCVAWIIGNESGWNPAARNTRSGAFGLGQALPASKIDPFGDRNDPAVQIAWMLDYIAGRYGSPCNARAVWQRQGWY